MSLPLILCIAGTDPSGGAGLPADARVCRAFGCYALGVVTAVVAQSTLGVASFCALSGEVVAAQLDAILADCEPAAVKVGMLASAEVVEAIGPRLERLRLKGVPVVFDPVLRSGHDAPLSPGGLAQTLIRSLLPHVDVLTPNVPEAQTLLQRAISDIDAAKEAARALQNLGPPGILLKGGHLPGAPGDVLAWRDQVDFLENPTTWPALDVHGTGCHLSTALACALVSPKDPLQAPQETPAFERFLRAVQAARAFLHGRFQVARWRPGRGREILGDW